MLRQRLTDAYKEAMKSRDARAISTMRMVLAQLKDRDIAARPGGNSAGIGEAEILDMLQGNRPELAQQEQEEIAVIERFMPQQLGEAEAAAAVDAALRDAGAAGMKDMGKVMGLLKERFSGRLDFAKAGALVKQRLNG